MSNAAQDLLNNFLDTVNDSVELESERVLCPEIDCNMTIKKVDLASGTSKSKDGEGERPWFAATIQYEIDSQEAREATGRDSVVVFGRPMYLNFLETGGLDPKNNIELGKLVKVLGLDTNVSTRDLLNSLQGQYLAGSVKHRTISRKDGEQVTVANAYPVGPAQ
jgi:hypothetical protein